jgi:hypothetical protein
VARIALAIGALVAIVYPIPLQVQGTTYYQTVGFLVLLNAMLGRSRACAVITSRSPRSPSG